MRVYFVGAHSTGKTTLCRYVSERYNLPMLPELARMVLAEQELNINTLRVDLDQVDDYQNTVVMRQFEEEKKHKSFVSDRSFDGLAYVAQHSRILNKLMKLPELASYVDTLRQPDALLFFVRPSTTTMKQDGVRETLNWEGIVQIDSMVKFLLEMHDLNYFQMNMDSMQERIRFVDSIIKLKSYDKFSK